MLEYIPSTIHILEFKNKPNMRCINKNTQYFKTQPTLSVFINATLIWLIFKFHYKHFIAFLITSLRFYDAAQLIGLMNTSRCCVVQISSCIMTHRKNKLHKLTFHDVLFVDTIRNDLIFIPLIYY